MTIINEVKRIVEKVMEQPFIYATEYNINEKILQISDQLPCVAMARQNNGTFEHLNGMKDSVSCLFFFIGLSTKGATDLEIAEETSVQKQYAKAFLKEVEKSSVIFVSGASPYQDFYDEKFDLFTTGVYLSLDLKELAGDVVCDETPE